MKLDELHMKIVTEAEEWPRQFPCRASVNSFGYGGANAHAILESIDSFMNVKHVQDEESHLSKDNTVLALPISAASQISLDIRVSQIAELVQRSDSVGLEQITNTLALHTPHMNERACLVLKTVYDDLGEQITVEKFPDVALGKRQTSLPIAFCFSGQGAQYEGMAQEALRDFPVFLDSIREQDGVLKALPPPYAPNWTLEETISNPSESTYVHLPSRSQPLTTAIQIGLVDVLQSWGIKASSVIGHSSGEIAAAYAAGILR